MGRVNLLSRTECGSKSWLFFALKKETVLLVKDAHQTSEQPGIKVLLAIYFDSLHFHQIFLSMHEF